MSIAYDPTTKEVAIAYVKNATTNGWADSFSEIYLATLTAPATTFTVAQTTQGSTDYYGAGTPNVAVSGGKIALAYSPGPYPERQGSGAYLWVATSTATARGINEPPPNLDAGPDAGDSGVDAGDSGLPPISFTFEAVPFSGGIGGYLAPNPNQATISLAIDSNGRRRSPRTSSSRTTARSWSSGAKA